MERAGPGTTLLQFVLFQGSEDVSRPDQHHPVDALQTAVAAAEVDKMGPLLMPIVTAARNPGGVVNNGDQKDMAYGGYAEDQGQDPRLLHGDAYLPNNSATYANRSMESPTYTVLSNAAMSTLNKPSSDHLQHQHFQNVVAPPSSNNSGSNIAGNGSSNNNGIYSHQTDPQVYGGAAMGKHPEYQDGAIYSLKGGHGR